MRLRVWSANGQPSATVRGKIPGVHPAQLVKAVLDLAPAGPGVIDFHIDQNRVWKIRVQGKLQAGGFEQRLRNILVNQ